MTQSKLTSESPLFKILQSLNTRDIWALAGAVLLLISSSFGLGYKMCDYLREVDREKMQKELQDKSKEITDLTSRLKAAERGSEFASTCQRYLIAEFKAKHNFRDGAQQELESATQLLVDQVYAWMKQQLSGDDTHQRIYKEFSSTDSRLVIFKDNSSDEPESIWVIPPEIKSAVLARDLALPTR